MLGHAFCLSVRAVRRRLRSVRFKQQLLSPPSCLPLLLPSCPHSLLYRFGSRSHTLHRIAFTSATCNGIRTHSPHTPLFPLTCSCPAPLLRTNHRCTLHAPHACSVDRRRTTVRKLGRCVVHLLNAIHSQLYRQYWMVYRLSGPIRPVQPSLFSSALGPC